MGQSTASVSTRALRENLRETLELAAKGKEILVTLRGKAYVRIVPVAADESPSNRYPLRGSVVEVAEDFDEASDGGEALPKKAAKVARGSARAAAPATAGRGKKKRK